MTSTRHELILNALWPASKQGKFEVWGILDCARDPRIYPALRQSRLQYRCLYSGTLPRALEAVAPHIVELFPQSKLLGQWLEEGWGEAWGVFVKIADWSNLRYHLRKFLKVQDEDERKLLFRYYDPRVLRVYLPTCTTQERNQMFGPIESFLMEDLDGREIVEFRRNVELPKLIALEQPTRGSELAATPEISTMR